MPTSHQPPRLTLPNRKLLLIQNPGRGSRNYLEGIQSALRALNIQTATIELQEIWDTSKTNPQLLVHNLSQILVDQRIGAVLGYGFNGMHDIPADAGPIPGLRSFFEIRNIPHLMLWLDHPQWHAELVGLAPQLQGMFRSANCYHFLKSSAHALEMERIVGWPNCFELPAGVDPDQFPVSPNAELAASNAGILPASQAEPASPQFDLVAICSENGTLPQYLQHFANLDNPNPDHIRALILKDVHTALDQLWQKEVPDGIRPEVTALGKHWSNLKSQHPFQAAIRHWPHIIEQFPGAAWYLTLAYPTYMNALRILWRLREWERRFYLAYLSRFCRVGIFGGDWSNMNLGPGGRVDFLKQSETYAKGRVALNITDGHDEEGLTMKPFEIAASGIPMLHYHAEGLTNCFQPEKEIMIFQTPKEAKEKLDTLLDNKTLRIQLAKNARERTLKDHTWQSRIKTIFHLARLPIENFQPVTQASSLHPSPEGAEKQTEPVA